MASETPNQKGGFYPNCDVNVWLRSCTEEISEPITGTITGTIPTWLRGCLLRNGPGSIKVGNDYFGHLFDSSALLHRFSINEGRVTYQCRFLQSEVLKRNRAANRIVLTEFGTKAVPDPCRTIFQRVASIFSPNSDDISDNSMISVYPFGDEMFAFGEIPIIHKIDQGTLETKDRIDVSKFVSIVHHTSHPHVMKDGTVFNLGLTIYPSGPYHTIVKFPSGKNMFEGAEIFAGIPARWPLHPTYMHTFGLTENYFVIVEQPLSVSVGGMIMNKIKNEPMASSFRWYQHEKTQFSLISRKTGQLAYKFHSEAFFYLHIINQYETYDHVIVDICTYRNPEMLDCMYTSVMKNMQHNPNYAEMFRSKPLRFVLPLKPAETNSNLIQLSDTNCEAYYQPDGEIIIIPEKLSDLGCETPRINYEQYLGKQYRYFYAISADVDAANPGTIIKVDTVTKTSKTWCEHNCYPSEPIFVPRPNCRFEDDGVVLAAMVWGGKDTNHVGLIILDAESFTEVARAEFRTPGPVPKCLHGWFLPN
ncbi:carotenoid isomerooxygenase [Tribolium madens]|uniref:carotenoid isomerooxygenase n=1 Tax=Tribolium madens TaxID=41895 RepID=UPI001CF7523B|nr:carotenoid isomerooxygenase [Tribolium madens]XP_044262088.1 carotenoid isomerooxygenase [Tribolium madens]XP_044262089.1 carotenoid isomerooxygenase [Tribolium madens]XP_044262090.1 carotenoid isomerooxygenase [Tribolium madens]